MNLLNLLLIINHLFLFAKNPDYYTTTNNSCHYCYCEPNDYLAHLLSLCSTTALINGPYNDHAALAVCCSSVVAETHKRGRCVHGLDAVES